jgi:cell division septation protein DedD
MNAARTLFRIAFLGTALLAPRSAPAQSDPRLTAAVRLAQEGQSDSARAVAGRLLASLAPADPLYPEALYTTGLLAATERDRRVQLRRVVVEFAESAWADDALLQLAQLDYATGNPSSTVRQIDQLLLDYPTSPLVAVAAFWGARAAADRRDGGAACRLADAGLAVAGSDVELRNQLEFQKTRCQSLSSLAADSSRAAAADSITRARADSLSRARADSASRARAPARTRRGFYVQISAVNTQAAASIEVERAKRDGFPAAAMKEGGFFKIRAGSYPSRAAADAALKQIKAKLGGRPFVVRVP